MPEHLPKQCYKRPKEPDHIVVALVRYPDALGDVDYICGFGYDGRSNPMVCVPAEGTVLSPCRLSIADGYPLPPPVQMTLSGGGLEHTARYWIVTPVSGAYTRALEDYFAALNPDPEHKRGERTVQCGDREMTTPLAQVLFFPQI